jgi:thiamine-monophosphate kinase
MSEFDIISEFFAKQHCHRKDVMHGIGDDAAIVTPPANQQLAMTTDTLVAGIHFLPSAKAFAIGYKTLAVNLSDLAAMGAEPAWVTLAVTLPEINKHWLQDFCDGFFALANEYDVQLIGGNLARGPLSITAQAIGFLPQGSALLRSQAKPHDLIYVTGTLGDAGLALMHSQLHQPTPRIQAGIALRGIAHAAIDISDGLAADLSHILQQSNVGAKINVDALPLSTELLQALPREKAIELALTAGDDYELCFTAAKDQQAAIEKKLTTIKCTYTQIGIITKELSLELHHQDGKHYQGRTHGYEHF